MNLKIFILLFLFIPFLSGDKPIPWKSDLKLTWEDFKGPAKLNAGAVAVTASGITFSYSVKRTNDKIVDFNALVEAHFYPENSWYIKEKSDDYILQHEQLHFDITELHVRILRYRISKLSVSQDIKERLKEMHVTANKELYEMQNLYDSQSNNSINKDFQRQWQLFVDQELKKYESYRSK